MNVEPPGTLVIIESIVYKSNGFAIEWEICHQGDYIRSVPGSTHSPLTQGGCLLLMKTSTDNEMLV